MNIKKLIFILACIMCFQGMTYADSPLTSTNFSTAYQEEQIIQIAAKSNGKLSKQLMEYLILQDRPLEIKIALINQLGWQMEGYENAKDFNVYLIQTGRFKSNNDFFTHADGDLLICMAYLKAMDNYFEVDDALSLARKAKTLNTKSFTTHLICALIEAQKVMKNDWCEVYNVTNAVRIDPLLNQDMKLESIAIIFEYTDLYKDEC